MDPMNGFIKLYMSNVKPKNFVRFNNFDTDFKEKLMNFEHK